MLGALCSALLGAPLYFARCIARLWSLCSCGAPVGSALGTPALGSARHTRSALLGALPEPPLCSAQHCSALLGTRAWLRSAAQPLPSALLAWRVGAAAPLCQAHRSLGLGSAHAPPGSARHTARLCSAHAPLNSARRTAWLCSTHRSALLCARLGYARRSAWLCLAHRSALLFVGAAAGGMGGEGVYGVFAQPPGWLCFTSTVHQIIRPRALGTQKKVYFLCCVPPGYEP